MLVQRPGQVYAHAGLLHNFLGGVIFFAVDDKASGLDFFLKG
jgi:hypothetical protein